MFGVDHLIPRPGIGLTEEGDDLIRPRAADHPVGVEAVHLGNRVAQGGMVCVGVTMQAVDGARKRLLGTVGRAEGVFIRRQLDRIRHARQMARPALIERDVEDAGLRSDLVVHVMPHVAALF